MHCLNFFFPVTKDTEPIIRHEASIIDTIGRDTQSTKDHDVSIALLMAKPPKT